MCRADRTARGTWAALLLAGAVAAAQPPADPPAPAGPPDAEDRLAEAFAKFAKVLADAPGYEADVESRWTFADGGETGGGQTPPLM